MQPLRKLTILIVVVGLGLAACAAPRAASTSAPSTQATHLPSIGKALTPTEAVPTSTPSADSGTGLHAVALNDLPREAQQTIRLIQQGGPFPSQRDGSIFQNREGLLPSQARGYYREYTVVTPGASGTGTRRIVAGQGGEFFYTEDRFVSFVQVIVTSGVPAPASAPTKAAKVATPKLANTSLPKSADGLRVVAVSDLPREAQHTVKLIQQGGPFPYSRDGVVYQNLERQLPAKPRGYYHEYTVVTPGASDRGARRIIAGGSSELYYTADHYASFVRVKP